MRRYLKIAVVSAIPLLGATACESFLEGGELSQNPNDPSEASIDQLFVAAQGGAFFVQSSEAARVVSMWMQSMAGTDRQYLSYGIYDHDEETVDDTWGLIYAGPGLEAIRQLKTKAEAANDQVYLGMGQVLEALIVGTATTLWGDIPYSEAGNPENPEPALDPQQEVYAALQQLLTDAISNLNGAGDGPGAFDLNYGGDTEAWIELAHTLKARFHLHTAERLGTPAYEAALQEAQQGISDPANDFYAVFTGAPGEENPWYQFVIRERAGYISAGEYLVELLKQRSPNNLLPEYFAPGSSANGEYIGAAPGTAVGGTLANLSETRADPAFAQPIVTWAENELIIAEAAYQTGDIPLAQTSLVGVQTALGLTTTPALTGAALLTEIMTVKYIVMFQNIESWNDYRRTCIPDLTPAGTATEIPGRLYYSVAERNANPNIMDPSEQPLRNWVDMNPCP